MNIFNSNPNDRWEADDYQNFGISTLAFILVVGAILLLMGCSSPKESLVLNAGDTEIIRVVDSISQADFHYTQNGNDILLTNLHLHTVTDQCITADSLRIKKRK